MMTTTRQSTTKLDNHAVSSMPVDGFRGEPVSGNDKAGVVTFLKRFQRSDEQTKDDKIKQLLDGCGKDLEFVLSHLYVLRDYLEDDEVYPLHKEAGEKVQAALDKITGALSEL